MPENSVSTLASYVPNLIIRKLNNDPSPITAPITEKYQAAVLFTHISGFIALADQLTHTRESGVEEISQILNAFFDELISLVNTQGGDVIEFANDSFLAIWPVLSDNDTLAGQTRRAAQCGLAIQGQFHNYQTTAGSRISLRIGMAAGEITFMHLGGKYGRWELLLTGKPLQQIRAAEKLALPGQIILTVSAWDLVASHFEGIHLPPSLESPQGGVLLGDATTALELLPIPKIEIIPKMDTGLRAYVPEIILSHLSGGQSNRLAEFCNITLLTILLPDFKDPLVLDQAQSVVSTIQTILYHYEGAINKLNIDERGVTLVADLELLPVSPEKNAVRAVKAAIDISKNLAELNVHCAIGVATGQMFCGSVGNDTRREYMLIGEVINLADRLARIATDTVLCDQNTFQDAQTHLEFETLSAVMLDGISEPVSVFRPTGKPKITPNLQIGLVGRIRERTMLAERLQTLLQDGQNSTVIIEGDAGIGKSRLVKELIEQSQSRGSMVLYGGGDAIESSAPYHAWRPILSRLLNLDENSDAETHRQQYLSNVEALCSKHENGEWLVSLAPLINSILPLDIPENEITAQMEGGNRAVNTRELLLCLLQATAKQQPLVLVLEDAMWLDSSSWALALQVSHNVTPLLLVLTLRPFMQPAPSEYQELINSSQTRRIQLHLLSNAEVVELVCQRLGVSTIPETIGQLIIEKAEGHPFFSEELTYTLRDSGVIKVIDNECHINVDAGDLSNLNFPSTIQEVISKRINRLPAQQQLTLKVASVIGRIFAFQILRDIYPLEPDKVRLSDYMSGLEKLEIAIQESIEPELTYVFKHVITQEVAYNLLQFTQRQKLHQSIAEWYENTYTDLSSFYPLLAHHWSKVDQPAKAIAYYEKAGEQAIKNHAKQEAISFIQAALELTKELTGDIDPFRKAHWHQILGLAYLGSGNLPESETHLKLSLALLGTPVPKTNFQFTLHLVLEFLKRGVHLLPFELSSKTPRENYATAARVYEFLGQIYMLANAPVPIVYVLLRILNLSEYVGQTPERARAFGNATVISGIIRRHSLARSYASKAQEIAWQIRHATVTATVLINTGLYKLNQAQWDAAQTEFKEAIEITSRIGDHRQWGEAMIMHSQAFYYQGQYQQASDLAVKLLLDAQKNDNHLHEAWGIAAHGQNILRLGQLDEAIDLLDESQELFLKNSGFISPPVCGVTATAHLQRGDLDLANKYADINHEILAKFGMPTSFDLIEGFSGVLEVYLYLWEHGEAWSANRLRKLSKQALKALRRYARIFAIGRPRTQVWQGLYEWLSGKKQKAIKIWQNGISMAREMGMPYEEGLAAYEIGRHLETDDPARNQYLNQAIEIFQNLKIPYRSAQAQAALHNPKARSLAPREKGVPVYTDQDRNLCIYLSDSYTPETITLLHHTLWGSKGGSLIAEHGITTALDHLKSPVYLSMEVNDRLAGVYSLTKKSVRIGDGRYNVVYRTRLAVKQEYMGNGYGTFLAKVGKQHAMQMLGESGISYGLIEADNFRSLAIAQKVGYQSMGTFRSTLFHRMQPKSIANMELLKPEDKGIVLQLLNTQYADHAFLDFEQSVKREQYYVIKKGAEIVIGVQAEPIYWNVHELPGLSGVIALKVLPHIPYIGKRINFNEFSFVKFGNLYVKTGYETQLSALIETLLAQYQRNWGLIMLDQRSSIYQRLKAAGIFKGIGASITVDAHVIADFKGLTDEHIEEICKHPLYISMNDI